MWFLHYQTDVSLASNNLLNAGNRCFPWSSTGFFRYEYPVKSRKSLPATSRFWWASGMHPGSLVPSERFLSCFRVYLGILQCRTQTTVPHELAQCERVYYSSPF
jgi:hypothetical protein